MKTSLGLASMARTSGACAWIACILAHEPAAAGAARGDGNGGASALVQGDRIAARVQSPQSWSFVENRGQWDTQARFVARNGPITARFERDSIWIQAVRSGGAGDGASGAAVRLCFEGSSQQVELVGRRGECEARSFFIGSDPSKWRTGVSSHAELSYRGLYPGVDVGVRSEGDLLEYDVLLAPGAALDRVIIRCEGIESLRVDDDGSLALATAVGTLRQTLPRTYRVLPSGERRSVACRYRKLDAIRYGFEVDDPDPSCALVIDPGLEWATFLGGSGSDVALAAAVDAAGLVTVSGWTNSYDFPTTPGAFDRTLNGTQRDVFVARLDPRQVGGAQLLWSTYLGGSDFNAGEQSSALALEPSGSVVVVGSTDSSDFPTTPGCFDPSYNGNTDAYVARISADGQALLYSTFLGSDASGSWIDTASAVIVDSTGAVIVAGEAGSPTFPTTSGAFSTIIHCNPTCTDGYVARLRLQGNGSADLLYSTFLGGGNWDAPSALALHPSGDVLVAGTTNSGALPSPPFPTTAGAYQTTKKGSSSYEDAFITRLRLAGNGTGDLIYSTFLGGQWTDVAYGLACDGSGAAVVGGISAATGNFPTTPGAFQVQGSTTPSTWDGFVSRLTMNGNGAADLAYSTYLSGPNSDQLLALCLNSVGDVLVAGYAGAGLPTTPGAIENDLQGLYHSAFVSRLRLSGGGSSDLIYSTYLGGSSGEQAFALAVDSADRAVVTGSAYSTDFPATSGAYDASYNQMGDVFVARLELEPLSPAVYCTAKVNSQGCTPAVAWSGTPTLGGADDFIISSSNVLNNKNGILFWSLVARAVPFGGGTLCVSSPIVRTGVQGSGGNPPPIDCSGSYAFHFAHAYMLANGLQSGDRVYAQYWSRDPGFSPPNNVGLTDAIAFTLAP